MLTWVVHLQKKKGEQPKIVNTGKENLHIFQATGGISMKFLEKTYFMIILKVRKNLDSPFLENEVWKTHRVSS